MKSETEQLNLRPDKRTIDKLQKLADKFNKRSKAQVAVEIIEQYMDFWESAEAAKRNVIDGQRRVLAIQGQDKVVEKSDYVVLNKPVVKVGGGDKLPTNEELKKPKRKVG